MGTIKAISGSTAFLLACCIVSGAMADAKATRRTASSSRRNGPSTAQALGPRPVHRGEAAILDCTNPTVQIPQIKKAWPTWATASPITPTRSSRSNSVCRCSNRRTSNPRSQRRLARRPSSRYPKKPVRVETRRGQ